MSQKFIARIGGVFRQIAALVVSAGVADANKIVATGSDGRLDASLMPVGIGATVTVVPAGEALSAGVFVQLYADGGVTKTRLADNGNGRAADGFVLTAVAADADAEVYALDNVNAELSGLTPGTEYWLGTAGGVIAVPLDAADPANLNKVCQHLGKAKSSSELLTTDAARVVL